MPKFIEKTQLVLGIETSCDETGVAIYCPIHGCIASALNSQTETHEAFGGVVPELSARDHSMHLHRLVQQCLDSAQITLSDIDGFAYTKGPGLISALLVGATFTRTLALTQNKPCVGIHHMEGHLLSIYLENTNVSPPFIALLISGGHTLLVKVKKLGDYTILGQTLDDAAGEAFDKSATLMGLSYPGGYRLSQLARQGLTSQYRFSRPMVARAGAKLSREKQMNFSFSGLKSEMRRAFLSGKYRKEDLAASFEEAVADTLVIKTKLACEQEKCESLIVAGGVAANELIRKKIRQMAESMGVRCFFPSARLCTDNGEMIAYAGYCRLNQSNFFLNQADFLASPIDVAPRWSLEALNDQYSTQTV